MYLQNGETEWIDKSKFPSEIDTKIAAIGKGKYANSPMEIGTNYSIVMVEDIRLIRTIKLTHGPSGSMLLGVIT